MGDIPAISSVLILVFAGALVCTILTALELPILRRLKAGQSIREEGPKAHLAKSGTPTMGGIAIILTFSVLGMAYYFYTGKRSDLSIPIIILSSFAYGCIGFYDDYLKVVKHQNEGLTSKQKMALQILVGLVFAVLRYRFIGTTIFIPFINKMWDMGWLIIPFSIFVFVAMTNAVNLTDGLDGLASSVTMNASACLGILILSGIMIIQDETTFGFSLNDGAGALSMILCGCCIGFLVFNHHPAKVFMGDTGSLSLGAALTSIAMVSKVDLALPIIGLVYVIEAISVIIQVFVFKTQNGRRFFRMAPIHHHFELGGWSEVKVDTVFSIVTLVMGILAILIF